MGIELVQWGEARDPQQKAIPEPGAVTLILRVTDANAIVARAVKAQLSMMRRNGGPPTLHDPDGFAVQVLQSDTPGADLSVGVSDVSKTVALYSKTLGFKVDGDALTVPGPRSRSISIRWAARRPDRSFPGARPWNAAAPNAQRVGGGGFFKGRRTFGDHNRRRARRVVPGSARDHIARSKQLLFAVDRSADAKIRP